MGQVILEDYLSVTGSTVIRLYLWDMLRKHMPKVWSGGTGMLDIPIIPHQDQPEAQTSEKPYIVYDFSYNPSGDLYQIDSETMTLRIFSQSPNVLTGTTKLCKRLFDRKDNTAQDINHWLYAEDGLQKYAIGDPRYDTWLDEARNIKFLTVSVTGTQGAAPAETQAGRLDTLVFIDMQYVEREWLPVLGV